MPYFPHRLVVQIEAYPPPRFNWYRNGRQIMPSQRIKISYENGLITLVIFNVQPADSGQYELRATNDMGEVVCTTTLDIKRKLCQWTLIEEKLLECQKCVNFFPCSCEFYLTMRDSTVLLVA